MYSVYNVVNNSPVFIFCCASHRAMTSSWDRTLNSWDLETGKLLVNFKCLLFVDQICFNLIFKMGIVCVLSGQLHTGVC